MIIPEGCGGAVFGTAAEGDARTDAGARLRFTRAGVPERWAYSTQVHGADVVEADRPGNVGEADAMFTTSPTLAVAVATADCVPVILGGDGFAAIVHAGWRGAAAGVVAAALDRLRDEGHVPVRAAIGPAIGPCCYEVGQEVLSRFPDHGVTTRWGTPGIDLPGIIAEQLAGLETWRSGRCTMTDETLYSFRRNRTAHRQVAVAWPTTG